MKKLQPDQKKQSTLKKEISTNRIQMLNLHKDASDLLAEVFNTLLNRKSDSKIIINHNLILKLFQLSKVELSEERKKFFQDYYYDLKKLHLIHCTHNNTMLTDPVLYYVNEIEYTGIITAAEIRIAELYSLKTDSQQSFLFDDKEKQEYSNFDINEFELHPKVNELTCYMVMKKVRSKHISLTYEVLHEYTSNYPDRYSKAVNKNKYKLATKQYSKKLNNHVYNKIDIGYFIEKIILPCLSLYLEKIDKIDCGILKECSNRKCLKIFPTYKMRFDSKVCSKICGTEKNRK
jgi:hypothetical protein